MPDTSTAIKINEIKNGKQALHVGFSKSKYYFVCAYYNSGHDDETSDYCCVTDYTWVKFNNANEISEEFDDLNFVMGFQINKASLATDIITKDANVSSVEHFQEYVPDFNKGLNAKDAISFDVSYIYLNSVNDITVYHSTLAYDNVFKTFPCVFLNGQYYIAVELYTVYPDGSRSNNDIIGDFGAYYDALVTIMDTTSYSLIDEKERTMFYGIIGINDFSNCVNE